MDQFIERELKKRRTLKQVLADLLAKHDRISPNIERNALKQMIEGLKAEIAWRKVAVSPPSDGFAAGKCDVKAKAVVSVRWAWLTAQGTSLLRRFSLTSL